MDTRIYTRLAIVGVAFLSESCGNGETKEATLVLGAVLDQTGPLGNRSWKESALLASQQANEGIDLAGGFRGLRFGLEVSDSMSNPTITAVRGRLLVENGAKAIITDTSDDAVVLNGTNYDSDATNDLGVPIVCIGCTSPNLGNPTASDPDPIAQRAFRDPKGWSFRTSADSSPEGIVLLDAIHALGENGDVNHDGKWKISVYVVDDEFGSGFFRSLADARDQLFPYIDEHGNLRPGGLRLEVVRHPANVDANAYDWSEDLRLLADNLNEDPEVNPGVPVVLDGRPDYIIEVTYPLFAAGFTRAHINAEERISKIRLFHSHNWRHFQTLAKLVTANIENQVGVSHALLDNCDTSGQTFSRAFRERTERFVGLWDAQVYDAATALMLSAVWAMNEHGLTEPASVTGVQLRDAMMNINDKSAAATKIYAGPEEVEKAIRAIENSVPIDYEGASGPVDFDSHGNVNNDFVRFIVRNNRFVDEVTFQCTEDPENCEGVAGACH